MASLKWLFILVCLGSNGTSPGRVAARGPENALANGFAQLPYSWCYFNWWRPYKVVLDSESVVEIQKQFDALTVAEARSADLGTVLGEAYASSFLYSVLSADQGKGCTILERLLLTYDDGTRLDDRWLLIVAALGQNASPEARIILEKELNRVVQGYEMSSSSPVDWVPRADARLPVADALFARMAAEQTLSANDIESLVGRLKPSPQAELLWFIGMEWAHTLMDEGRAIALLESAISDCADTDLRDVMDFKGTSSTRLAMLNRFITSSQNVRPTVRRMVLGDRERREILAEYILVMYTRILVNQAHCSEGGYDVDEALIDAYTNRDIKPWKLLARNSWILLRCTPSFRSPRWEAFLEEHASRIAEGDREEPAAMLARIREPKPQSFIDTCEGVPPANLEKLTDAGVYLWGFSRAHGRNHR